MGGGSIQYFCTTEVKETIIYLLLSMSYKTGTGTASLYLHGTPTHGNHVKQGDSLHLFLFTMATSCFSFVLYFGTPVFTILWVFEDNLASPLQETEY